MFLKFRAWDSYRKKIVTNFVLAPTSPTWAAFPIEQPDDKAHENLKEMELRKGYDFPCGDYTLTDWSNFYGIEHYKVMQFSGLKDKNDREIYEGDIVDNVYIEGIQYPKGIVKFDSGCFVLVTKDKHIKYEPCLYEAWKEYIEVIGNIYENPEIMKGE